MPSDHKCSSGFGVGGDVEIADFRQQHQVSREQRACKNVLAKGIQLVEREEMPAKRKRHDQHYYQRRENSSDASRVEIGEAEFPFVQIAKNNLSNQISGDDEEYIDADETARKYLWKGMKITAITASARSPSMSGLYLSNQLTPSTLKGLIYHPDQSEQAFSRRKTPTSLAVMKTRNSRLERYSSDII